MKALALCFLISLSLLVDAQSLVDPNDSCDGVQCPELQCRRVVKVEGKCCAECEDPCLTTVCPEFTRCETDSLKTRAACVETCENNGKCGSDAVCELETSKVCLSGRDLCLTRATCRPGCPDVERKFVDDVCFARDGPQSCQEKGKRYCVSIGDAQSRSFICTCRNWGVQWSRRGPIQGMRCTNIREPLKDDWNDDQYLCLPNWTSFHLTWSSDGSERAPFEPKTCVEWKVFGDDKWANNFLCQHFPPNFPNDFKYFHTGPVNTDDFFHCQKFVGINEEAWLDNAFCAKQNTGLVWSNQRIPNMNCDYFMANRKTYFCTPQWWGYRLESYWGGNPHEDQECIRFVEPDDDDFNAASICKAKICSVKTNCRQNCSAGYVYDSEGCKTCECKPDHCSYANCPHVRCRKYEYVNDACCSTCVTPRPNECRGLAECSLHCSYGYKKDSFGCDVCSCKENPCSFIHCASGFECRINSMKNEPYCTRAKNGCDGAERFESRSIPCWGKQCNSIGVCEKEECGDFVCTKSCPGGFYLDLTSSRRGCPTCQCKPERCSPIKCPPLPMCNELAYVGDSCCPVCKPRCSFVECDNECSNGYELDEFGCQSCTCKKFDCDVTKCASLDCANPIQLPGQCCPYCSQSEVIPPLKCEIIRNCPPCKGGRYQNYLGCDTCKCKPDFCKSITCSSLICGSNLKPIYREGSCCPICSPKFTCPLLSCNISCSSGYEVDMHGCATCQCKPITCSSITCTKPTICENPVDVEGTCCRVCPKAEWKVLAKCGYVNKYWNMELGRWINDPEGRTVNCQTKNNDVLNVCRTLYPRQAFYSARKLKAFRSFDDWCEHGNAYCGSTFGAFEWECITNFGITAKDMRFLNDNNANEVSTLSCTKFTPNGINSNNFCLRRPISLKFSHKGPLSGMKCTPIREPDDATFDWSNAYICSPKSTSFALNFYNDGLPADVEMKSCIATPFSYEGIVDESWKNNYICINNFNFVCNKTCDRYQKNANGVPTCECAKDPCDSIECGKHQECRWDIYTELPFCEDTCKNNGKCAVYERCETHYNFDRRTRIATCKPKCTEFKPCNLDCPSGFAIDSSGCRKCTCRPDNCTNVRCLALMCSKPVLPDGECCPVCPAKCRCTKLTKYCPAGYEVDPEFGCFLDECKPDQCIRVKCPAAKCNRTVLARGECCPRCVNPDECPLRKCVPCKSGYMIDRLGCQTCECKPDACKGINCPSLSCKHKLIRSDSCCPSCVGDVDGVVCPHRRCNRFCKNGFEADSNGCPTCNCKPEACDKKPCDDSDSECQLDDAANVEGKCGLKCPMKGLQCPTLPCANPVYFGSESCPRCPARCPPVRCQADCTSTGYKYVNGCMTCECKPSRCAQRACPQLTDCKYLIWTDNDPCCPKCKETHCSDVDCPATKCDIGFKSVEIRGKCCTECRRSQTPVPYVCPATYECTKACPGGYKTNVYGCPTCECKPASCRKVQCPALLPCNYDYDWDDDCCQICPSTRLSAPHEPCPPLPCENPVRFSDELCPRCPARCANVRCKTRCATGYKYDANGCMTCQCRPLSCAARKCPQLHDTCDYVIWTADDECCPKCAESHCKGASGCPTSCPPGKKLVPIRGQCCARCMDSPTPVPYVCEAKRQCTLPCSGGYKVDLFGCPTCDCKPDACKDVRCPASLSCSFSYNYNSQCCPKCAPPDAATKPMCPEVRCGNPVFVAGEMCPMCPMKSHFPDDFKFFPTLEPTPYCNWHDVVLDWGPDTKPSLIKTRFPRQMKFSRHELHPGMQCTPVGYVNNVAQYYICVPADSHIRVRFYRDEIDRDPKHTPNHCLRIDADSIHPGFLCQVGDVMIPELDLVRITSGSSDFYTKFGWTCLDDLCTRYNFGFQWNNTDEIAGMKCTRVNIDDGKYFCVPKQFDFDVIWSDVTVDHMVCLEWVGSGHLCFYNKICSTRLRDYSKGCPDGFSFDKDQDGCQTSNCRRTENDANFYCNKKCPFGFKRTPGGDFTCECISGDVENFESCHGVCSDGFRYSLETGFRMCRCKRGLCSFLNLTKSWNKAKRNCDYPVTIENECEYKCPEKFNSDALCDSGKCPTLKCSNPVHIKGRCCPLCPNSCPQVKCVKDCPNGFATDMHGCRRCHCLGAETEAKRTCPELACTNDCPGGHRTDSDGCKTCQCKPAECIGVTCPTVKCSEPVHKPNWCCPRCPKVKNDHCPTRICKKACPGGFEFDENGCMTCECKPDHCNRLMGEACWNEASRRTCLKWVNIVEECRQYCADDNNGNKDDKPRCSVKENNSDSNHWGCEKEFEFPPGRPDSRCSARGRDSCEDCRSHERNHEMNSKFSPFH